MLTPLHKTDSLTELLSKNRETKIVDLPTDKQVLFGLLCLIVDIKYKNKYGKTFEYKEGRQYKMNSDETEQQND